MLPSKEKLDTILKKLQEIMRLQDWDITLEIINAREMDATAKRNYIPGGYCGRNRHYKTATISINRESDDASDWYMVLVHELHHVQMDNLDSYFDNYLIHSVNENERDDIENGFNFEIERLNCALTRAFMNAYPVTKFEEDIWKS
jgi:hypothetical protein